MALENASALEPAISPRSSAWFLHWTLASEPWSGAEYVIATRVFVFYTHSADKVKTICVQVKSGVYAYL